jgi:hypothetical protein
VIRVVQKKTATARLAAISHDQRPVVTWRILVEDANRQRLARSAVGIESSRHPLPGRLFSWKDPEGSLAMAGDLEDRFRNLQPVFQIPVL